MRLSWNEIRARAADFAREWADAAYEKGETQSFYNNFFEMRAPLGAVMQAKPKRRQSRGKSPRVAR